MSFAFFILSPFPFFQFRWWVFEYLLLAKLAHAGCIHLRHRNVNFLSIHGKRRTYFCRITQFYSLMCSNISFSNQMGFAAGYGLACMSWVQLLFVCELGENVQVKNRMSLNPCVPFDFHRFWFVRLKQSFSNLHIRKTNHLKNWDSNSSKAQCIFLIPIFHVYSRVKDHGFAEMYYEVKWEVLPVNIQKAIMLLIHRKQNERAFKMGPFGVGINRELFKLVIAL